MHRTRLSISILAIVLLSLSQAVVAICEQPQPRLLRAEYGQSDAVVIAHLVKSQHIIPKGDQDYRLRIFEVEKTLRGGTPTRFVLWDENSSARLTFPLLRGQSYLLFVNRMKASDWWTADGCGHSGALDRRTNTLSEIERITSLGTACISGQVEGAEKGSKINVVAIRKQDEKHFDGRTSTRGTFTLNVPPGEYSVTASASGMKFATHYFSYEDAELVKLARGACAQILFVPSDSPEAFKAAKNPR